jgi:hypothetical protein
VGLPLTYFQTNSIIVPPTGGEPTQVEYHQMNSTQFEKITKYGNGADAHFLSSKGGIGSYSAINATTNTIIFESPGGGGNVAAGGSGAYFGSDGGGGLILIWY